MSISVCALNTGPDLHSDQDQQIPHPSHSPHKIYLFIMITGVVITLKILFVIIELNHIPQETRKTTAVTIPIIKKNT